MIVICWKRNDTIAANFECLKGFYRMNFKV